MCRSLRIIIGFVLPIMLSACDLTEPAAAPPPAAPDAGFTPMLFFEPGEDSLKGYVLDGVRITTKTVLQTRYRVCVTGHADGSGHEGHNLALSMRRANAVRDEMIRQGFPAERIEARARGSTQPLVQVVPHTKPEPQNRRVEIRLELAPACWASAAR